MSILFFSQFDRSETDRNCRSAFRLSLTVYNLIFLDESSKPYFKTHSSGRTRMKFNLWFAGVLAVAAVLRIFLVVSQPEHKVLKVAANAPCRGRAASGTSSDKDVSLIAAPRLLLGVLNRC